VARVVRLRKISTPIRALSFQATRKAKFQRWLKAYPTLMRLAGERGRNDLVAVKYANRNITGWMWRVVVSIRRSNLRLRSGGILVRARGPAVHIAAFRKTPP
jgi:hypothetical protein